MSALLRSLRILRRNLSLTLIAILSLSMAMLLAVVGLSISETSLMVPPPGESSDRLVEVYLRSPGENIGHVSYPDYQYYRANNHVFTDVAAIPEDISLMRVPFGPDSATSKPLVNIAFNPVSENYFSVLGIRPFLGRLFGPGDDSANRSVAVMTYSCWKRLGSDPKIVGKLIGGLSIVGVTPKEFTGSMFGINGDLLVPPSGNEISAKRDERHLTLLARLRPGISLAQARADLVVLSGQLAHAYPTDDKGRMAIVTRATLLPPDAIPTAELVSSMLLVLVLLVLLIACSNVANLLLAIAVGRRQEATIKVALGASRGRLIRDFLREGAIICAVSSVLGYAVASFVIARYSTVNVNLPTLGSYPLGLKLHLGIVVVASTIALMAVATLATGLPGALYASSPNLAEILAGEAVVGATRKAIRRNVLTVVEVAVCTVVLVGMGLCVRSLHNLRQLSPGFSARNLVTEMMFPREEGHSDSQGKLLYDKVRTAVSAIPGVQSVAVSEDIPLFGGSSVPVRLPGGAAPVSVRAGVVDYNYFSTLGIPLIAGRVFSSSDTAPSPDVLVINQKMAETFWPSGDPVGKEVLTGDPPRSAVIIGVVGDGKYDDLAEKPQAYMYYALSQHYNSGASVIARTTGDPRLWATLVAKAVRSVGFKSDVKPMTFGDVENLSLLPERIVAGGVAALSTLGLVLAIVGLFGTVSYSVSERRREFGIRVALGAQPWQLLRLVFRQTLLVAGSGTLLGALFGVGATMLLRSQFYGIGSVEWSVLTPVAAGMLLLSFTITYLSARSYIKVDPLETIRHA